MSHERNQDHLHRQDYGGLTAALIDAERVLGDLVTAIAEPVDLFPDADALEFLAHRARKLVTAARVTAMRGGT